MAADAWERACVILSEGNMKTKKDKYHLRQKLFEDYLLVDTESDVPNIEVLNERYLYDFEPGDFQVLALKLNQVKNKYEGWLMRNILEEMCAKLQRILMECCYEIEVFIVHSTTYVLCNYPDENMTVFRQELERVVNRFSEMQYLFWEVKFSVGVGGVVQSPKELQQSTIEARNAIKESVFSRSGPLFEGSKTDAAENYSEVIRWFQLRFDYLMEILDEHIIADLIAELKTRICKNLYMGGKEFIDVIGAMGTYAIIIGRKNDYNRQIGKFMWECDLCASQDQVLECLEKLLEEIVRDLKMRAADENPVIRKARSFMLKHYADDINLQTVAEYVGFSPNYFSSYFKKTAEWALQDT